MYTVGGGDLDHSFYDKYIKEYYNVNTGRWNQTRTAAGGAGGSGRRSQYAEQERVYALEQQLRDQQMNHQHMISLLEAKTQKLKTEKKSKFDKNFSKLFWTTYTKNK